jgi:hypothetical protein
VNGRSNNLLNFSSHNTICLSILLVLYLFHDKGGNSPFEEIFFDDFNFFVPEVHHKELGKPLDFLLCELVQQDGIIFKGEIFHPSEL